MSRWAAALVLLLSHLAAVAGPNPGLVLGVHPYLSYSQMQLAFQPLARYLAEALHTPVALRIGSNYREHIDEIGQDRLDIAYIGPMSYVRLVEQYGRKPLLARLERNGRPILEGNIVVGRDSGLREIADLRGKSFAFGDPESTMSTVVPQAVLATAGIRLADLGRVRHFTGHGNIALSVLTGRMDAGAVKREVYRGFRDRGLRSLAELPEVSEHLFVVRADLPPAMVERLRAILLGLAHDEGGRKVLKSIHRDATGLVPVTDADYDSLRQMLRVLAQPDARPDPAN